MYLSRRQALTALSAFGMHGTARRWVANTSSKERSAKVSRAEALGRWNATAAAAGTSSDTPDIVGKGMQFASSLAAAVKPSSTRTAASALSTTVADVKWDLCERMDYYVQYSIPANWHSTELVRDNSVAIQCSPPLEGGRPSVHGISLNCFAYKQKVKEPKGERLLRVFLQRFNASVGNSLQIVSQYAGASGASAAPATDNTPLAEVLANQLHCAVAEVTFTPASGLPLARGLCRAFYNSNCRFHYVVIVAVPADEYDATEDLVVHALVSVTESRVEAAAKWT